MATLIGCVFGACSNDRADLIGPASTGASGASGMHAEDAEPWLPALPDEANRAGCEACAKRECGQARSDCLEDDACTALLDCKSACDSPACLYDCEAAHGFSGWYDDLWQCVFLDCATDCNAGRNWGCVGEYRWRAADDLVFDVTVRFRTTAAALLRGEEDPADSFLIGAEVRSCPPTRRDCANPDGTATVDRTNAVKLAIQRVYDDISYLEIENEAHGGFGQRELVFLPVISRSSEIRFEYVPRGNLAPGGWTQPADAPAAVAAYVTDCLSAMARGVRVEVPSDSAVQVLHFSNSVLSPDLSATGFGFAFVPAVVAEDLVLRVVRTDTGEPVAERSVNTRPGWLSHAVLSPLLQ